MKYVLGILGVLAVAIIAIILIGHRSPTSTKVTTKATVATPKLLTYDNPTSQIRVTIEGPIVGEDQYQTIQLTASQSTRTLDITSGYEGNVIKTETFPNTPAAYTIFLKALNNDNFTKSRPGVTADEGGACASGNRHVYEIINAGKTVQRLWNDSCDVSQGSFGGNGPLSRQLIERQFANYNDFVSDTHVLQ